jgi:cell division protease FtsH
MVREWGMSDAIGPMAWGSQGQVFLGEDLMHTRDYSEDTSKIIDDEVERILRAEEQRAMDLLSKHRGGLNAIARALLDNEIIDGAEVARLVDEAHGSPVHGEGVKSVPHFSAAAIAPNGKTMGNGDHGDEEPLPVTVVPPPVTGAATPEREPWPPPPWPPAGPAPGHGDAAGDGAGEGTAGQ